MYYQEDMTDSFGIDGYRFAGTADSFDGTLVSGSDGKNCYCIEERCGPQGKLFYASKYLSNNVGRRMVLRLQ